MNTFAIGTVVEPEIVSTTAGNILKFGFLVNRSSREFGIFEYTPEDENGKREKNPLFIKLKDIQSGETMICVLSHSVSKNGFINCSLRDASPCDISFKEALQSHFNEQR